MQASSVFGNHNRQAQKWFSAGLASSFPDILDSVVVSSANVCGDSYIPGCKVLQFSPDHGEATEFQPGEVEEAVFNARDLKHQVLVFQYKGKFHAMEHQCPHSSFPLSQGTTFDIEDFGIVLSAGITCPKHGWSFDLFSGQSDRSAYKLKLWDIQIRPVSGEDPESEQEIWIRKKQRIG